MTTQLLARLGVVVAIGALTAGIVYATIPDSSGVIHACYAKSGGTLQVIDDSVTTCRGNETSLSWNAGTQVALEDSRLLTVRTFGNGTANNLTIPDLGTLTLECSPTGVPSLTLNGGAVFERVKVTADGASASVSANTTFTSGSSFGESLWLTNVQGQWRLEYMTLATNVPLGNPCHAAAEITRIN